MSDDNCLDATGTDGIVKLIRCHGMGGNQAWIYDAKVQQLNSCYCVAVTNVILIYWEFGIL